ncbi:MAG: hypothetical protein AAGE96_14690 [Cyanobacteria bacterium P01_G01_bin.19]
MSENEFDRELDLLVPWDIPIESQLDRETQEQLSEVLMLFLQALSKSSLEEALSEIAHLLEYLNAIDTTSVEIENTQTPIKNWEVKDYDRFFKINRIQTNYPEIALVKGLLQNTHTFLLLCQQCGDRLDSPQIELQKQGFITYARLLARSFNLQSFLTE